MATGIGFMMVAMINIIVQSVRQVETGIATEMNTIFRTIGGVVGPAIAGVYLAQYVSSLIIQTPRGPLMGPLLPSETAFNYMLPTALAIPRLGVLMALLKGNGTETEMQEPFAEAAAAV